MTDGARVVIEVRDGEIQFTVEQTSVKDLMSILGYYTGFVVTKAVKCGADADDIRQAVVEIVLDSVAGMKDVGRI